MSTGRGRRRTGARRRRPGSRPARRPGSRRDRQRGRRRRGTARPGDGPAAGQGRPSRPRPFHSKRRAPRQVARADPGGSSPGSRKRASGERKRGTKRRLLALRVDEEIGLGHEGEEPKLIQRLRKPQEDVSEPAFVLRARMHAEALEWLERDEGSKSLSGDMPFRQATYAMVAPQAAPVTAPVRSCRVDVNSSPCSRPDSLPVSTAALAASCATCLPRSTVSLGGPSRRPLGDRTSRSSARPRRASAAAVCQRERRQAPPAQSL